MAHDTSHPSREDLQRLLDGQLDDTTASQMNAVLEQCVQCQRQLDAILLDQAAQMFASTKPTMPTRHAMVRINPVARF